jgi:hypothetical protein
MNEQHAFIIEPELSHQKVISDVLHKINPDIKVYKFKGIKEFFEAYKTSKLSSTTDPNPTNNPAPNPNQISNLEETAINFDNVKLIVADIEATHKVDQNLWRKFLKSLKNHEKESEHSPRFLYTSYDRGEFDPHSYHSDVVYNILLKPLDPMIIHQILLLALKKDGPIELDELYKQEKPATIELIKDIEIERLTELGFRTKSKRPIEINKIAKYFGNPFGNSPTSSVFAYCYANYKTNDQIYSSSFSYFGISRDKLASIRRTIQNDKTKEDFKFVNPSEENLPKNSQIIILSKDEQFISDIKRFLNDKFTNHKINNFYNTESLIQYIPPHLLKKASGETSYLPLFDIKTEIVLKFDENMEKIISFYESNTDGNTCLPKLFNLDKSAVLKSKDFLQNLLTESSKKEFIKIKKDSLNGEEIILEICIEGQTRFLKYISKEKQLDINLGNVFVLKFKELNQEETYNHLNKNKESFLNVTCLIVDEGSYKNVSIQNIKNIIVLLTSQGLESFKTFLFSKSAVEEYKHLEIFKNIDDVFQLPLDTFYLTRKLKMHCPQLQHLKLEDGSRLGIEMRKGIKTALPLIIDCVSEVHISFKYPRQIRLGDVRRLVLNLDTNKDMPEILAICRYCEKVSENVFRCDFLFFAVQDRQLKHIRQWIKKNYIDEKNKSSD